MPDNDIGDEESWTFIGDESDPELARRIAEWDPAGQAVGFGVGRKRSVISNQISEGAALGSRVMRGSVS